MCPRSRDCRSHGNGCHNYSYGIEQRRGSRRNGCRGQQAPRDDDHDGAPKYDQHHISPAYNDNHYYHHQHYQHYQHYHHQHYHHQHYHDQHYHDDGAARRRTV